MIAFKFHCNFFSFLKKPFNFGATDKSQFLIVAGGKSIRKPPAAPPQRFHLKYISMFAGKMHIKQKLPNMYQRLPKNITKNNKKYE